jgi:hypothetical protein
LRNLKFVFERERGRESSKIKKKLCLCVKMNEMTIVTRTKDMRRRVSDRMTEFKTETKAITRESEKSMLQLRNTKEAMKDMDLEFAILEANILQNLDELRMIYKSIVCTSSVFPEKMKHNKDKGGGGGGGGDDRVVVTDGGKKNEDHRAPRMNENPFPPTTIDTELSKMDEDDEDEGGMFNTDFEDDETGGGGGGVAVDDDSGGPMQF